jgi:predicted esterase
VKILVATATLLLAGPLSPAGPGQPDGGWPRGQIVERVVCQEDPSESYALYLPSAYVPGRRWPIVYALDPRGVALVPAERLREGAERYGFVVASSYTSRSDEETDPNPKSLAAMWRDTHARLALDVKRAYAAGFSGTARSALRMADATPGGLAGVIACGAGFARTRPVDARVAFDVFGVAGDADFNYQELQALAELLEGQGVAHRVESFDGAHEWPPAPLLTDALAWFEVRGMQEGRRPRDMELAAGLFARWQEEAAALEQAGRVFEARRRFADLARDFDGLADVAAARAATERLRGSDAHERERRARQKWREREQEYENAIPRALSRLRLEAPALSLKEALAELHVAELRRKAERADDPLERLSARRSLSMLSAQTGVYRRRLRPREDAVRTALMLAVAAEANPARPQVWYNLACARAQAGWKREALQALERAVEAGFTDLDWMEQDTDLAALRGEAAYRALVARLAAAGKT